MTTSPTSRNIATGCRTWRRWRRRATVPAGVGTTYQTTEEMKPGSKMRTKTYSEIVTLERPRLIEWRARTEATSGPMAMRSRWAFLIEPDGTGSRVTQRVQMEPPNLWSKIMMRVFVTIADGILGGLGASPKNVAKHVAR